MTDPLALRLLAAGGALLALAGCAVLAAFLWRRRSRRKQLADQLSRKLREEALDQALSNPHAPAGRSVPDPVQVTYSPKADRKGDGALLRLTEHNPTVTRTYLFDRGQRLFLGIQDGRTVIRRDYAPQCGILCEVYQNQQAVFVRGLASGGQLRRGRTTRELSREGVALRSGDELLLPGTQFRVELL